MASAKQLIIKVLPSKIANDFIRLNHYSKKVVPNSQLHFGVFYNNRLHGVMSFGPSINKKGTINLVKDTQWNEFIELNRLAFDEVLPKNSESRAISVAMRLIAKQAPQIKWVISFADATQCGDGAIYRASGFTLTGIAKNTAIRINPANGAKVHIIQAHHLKIPSKEFRSWGVLNGYMLRYIYFIDPTYRARLTVLELPYSEIEKRGAGMYKGVKRERGETDNAAQSNVQTDGASPIRSLLETEGA